MRKAHKVALGSVMPILHGKNGEDGTVQGLLELAGISSVQEEIRSSKYPRALWERCDVHFFFGS